jgi:hypothetical protein
MFWANMPAVNVWRIDMEHKGWRSGFNAPALAAYGTIQESTIASWQHAADNGGAFELLDFLAVSKACGRACTSDGLHFSGTPEQALVQVLANIYALMRPPPAECSLA